MTPKDAVREFLLQRSAPSFSMPAATGSWRIDGDEGTDFDLLRIPIHDKSQESGTIHLHLTNFMLESDHLRCSDINGQEYRLEYADPTFFEQLEAILAGKRLVIPTQKLIL